MLINKYLYLQRLKRAAIRMKVIGNGKKPKHVFLHMHMAKRESTGEQIEVPEITHIPLVSDSTSLNACGLDENELIECMYFSTIIKIIWDIHFCQYILTILGGGGNNDYS